MHASIDYCKIITYICGLFKIKFLPHASENKMRANRGQRSIDIPTDSYSLSGHVTVSIILDQPTINWGTYATIPFAF